MSEYFLLSIFHENEREREREEKIKIKRKEEITHDLDLRIRLGYCNVFFYSRIFYFFIRIPIVEYLLSFFLFHDIYFLILISLRETVIVGNLSLKIHLSHALVFSFPEKFFLSLGEEVSFSPACFEPPFLFWKLLLAREGEKILKWGRREVSKMRRKKVSRFPSFLPCVSLTHFLPTDFPPWVSFLPFFFLSPPSLSYLREFILLLLSVSFLPCFFPQVSSLCFFLFLLLLGFFIPNPISCSFFSRFECLSCLSLSIHCLRSMEHIHSSFTRNEWVKVRSES